MNDRVLNAPPDDADLIARIGAGDETAVRVLYARHHVRVYRFVLRFVRKEAVAEEIVNEVFLDVWRNADRFEGRAKGLTWLLTIARNKAISTLRRRPELELDEKMAVRIEDMSDTPEVSVQKADKSALIRACIGMLSPEHREIIDLVYYHEMSIRDVGEIVGIPTNTVKTRMFYARKKLSELLAANGIDRGWP